MKKFQFLLILIFAFLILGCGKKMDPTLEDYLEPEPVNELNLTAYSDKIVISWSYSEKNKSKLGSFLLERESIGGTKSLGFFSPETSSFEDKEFSFGTLKYRIFAINKKGIYSKPVENSITLSSLPQVTQLQYKITQDGVMLSWKSDSVMYNIYKIDKEKIKIGSTDKNYFLVEENFVDNSSKSLTYLVTPYISQPNVYIEGEGAQVEVPLEYFVPSQPKEVFWTINENGIYISWEEVPEKWVKGYKVYRKTVRDADFVLIGKTRIPLFFDIEYNINSLQAPIYYRISSEGPLKDSSPVEIKVERLYMDRILLGHGSGGKLMHDLIKQYIAPVFELSSLMDSAVLSLNHSGKVAITTDSYTVSPIFFPGGDIGELAINGTVNDLAVVGAIPLYLTVGFILEEGFPMSDFERVLKSISNAAKKADVKIVAGDTKVVDKGKGDGIFINTSGIGVIPEGVELSPLKIEVGDKVLISGSIGNHGIAIMAERNGFNFEPPVLSDTRPLNGIINEILKNFSSSIKVMRDPTRGGVATTLKELALESQKEILIYENAIPLHDTVKGACELLGLDPLYVANEGIFVAVVSSSSAEQILKIMKEHPFGRESAIIGEVIGNGTKVLLKTSIGGTRMVDMLPGEQLPRIC